MTQFWCSECETFRDNYVGVDGAVRFGVRLGPVRPGVGGVGAGVGGSPEPART